MRLPDIESVSAAVHQAWIDTKLAQGITSRPAADGREQMVPYAQLDEDLKELDRSTVRAVYGAIEACRRPATKTEAAIAAIADDIPEYAAVLLDHERRIQALEG